MLVALLLVIGHCFVERARSGEGLVKCDHTAFDVAEGVVNPLRRDRVFVVARVAHERPARTERFPEKIRHGQAGERGFSLRLAYPFRERWHEIEHLQKVALDV
ncbi:MAG TPA: hypothetical protein VFG23_10300, partial [Polyangia bacterium]|nr:hypothetical protein [Polyangia bacterium]